MSHKGVTASGSSWSIRPPSASTAEDLFKRLRVSSYTSSSERPSSLTGPAEKVPFCSDQLNEFYDSLCYWEPWLVDWKAEVVVTMRCCPFVVCVVAQQHSISTAGNGLVMNYKGREVCENRPAHDSLIVQGDSLKTSSY